MTPSSLFAFAGAGSVGALARWFLVAQLQERWPGLPWPVAVVNVLGCFCFGVCWSFGDGRWSPATSAVVLSGFFGAFTTFSSFAFDCHRLLAEGRLGLLCVNVLGQNLLGLGGLAVGITLGLRLAR
ncbi:MAG: CrcB family protein [Planctomycetes bacterium]|nr:CrcB family protein [Planctomycetota bacterium]